MAIVSNEDKELDDFAEEMKNDDKVTSPQAQPKEEDKAETYKRILLDLGFHKKQNGNDKEQYVKKEGELVIGRTFSEKIPGGTFWGIQNDKFLQEEEVKKLAIVQEFYDVRDGKKQSTLTGQHTERVEAPFPTSTVEAVSPNEMRNDVQKISTTKGVTREIGAMAHVVKGGFYPVRGHKEPDAWMVQQWANGVGISIEIIIAEQTETEAKVVVRATKDDQYVDAVVIHEFSTTKEVVAFEAIDKMLRKRENPIVGYEDNGKPILSDNAKYVIYKNYIKFKNFSIRDATTKAGRIAILKLMNKEWRDPDEIEAETAEVRAVNEK